MNFKTTATLAALAFAGTAMGADVAANGGFELGMGADADSWEEFGGASRDSSAPIAGDWSMQLNASEASGNLASGVTYNSVFNGGFASLEENTNVNLSFDANINLGVAGVANYVVRILNDDGAIVADSGFQGMTSANSLDITVPSFGPNPNDVFAAFVLIQTQAGAVQGSFAEATIDNVVIDATLVPAPGALALLGLGGLGIARRRR